MSELFPFPDPGVSAQESSLLERTAELWVEVHQSSSNAQPNPVCLAVHTSTDHLNGYIKDILHAGFLERSYDGLLHGFQGKVLNQISVVNLDGA